jgi:hypothetical protein
MNRKKVHKHKRGPAGGRRGTEKSKGKNMIDAHLFTTFM